MKVIISSGEQYPVFTIERTWRKGYNGKLIVDIEKEWLERYEKCMVEWDLIQEYLTDKYPF